MGRSPSQWEIDRKVPLALICTLFFNMGITIWWAATTTEGLSNIKERVARIESKLEKDS